ncbi:DUF2848 family protein [Aquisalibacillus elongatus]|uniref:Uncharacterized protein DUF2848 n=1 Tax=Aquisalibacillus elongatus TaxID=485577 RepID=A0A3N5B9C0_9BACI|nr:DUF2848 family protein [Aquisalibacillus elongatus]RPF54326.1 uncharacterized protein DUF2848 [Aquisalibacillus elongatus]
MTTLTFNLDINGVQTPLDIAHVYCIGYTGRNKEKTLEHIKELKEIGIPEPSEVPALYPIRLTSLNQLGQMDVIGGKTSGEAEIVLLFGNDETYITVGSDHTDRGLETVDINKSKQVCDKPFASEAWTLSDVKDHWDQLELSSEILINGEWVSYQQHEISAIIPYEEIVKYLEDHEVPFENSIVFAGTVPLLDGFKFGEGFKMRLNDPILNKTIVATYTINQITGDE